MPAGKIKTATGYQDGNSLYQGQHQVQPDERHWSYCFHERWNLPEKIIAYSILALYLRSTCVTRVAIDNVKYVAKRNP
jgi:hypothetical protein